MSGHRKNSSVCASKSSTLTSPSRILGCFEEPFFQKRIDELRSEYPEIHEVRDAVIWRVARQPGIGLPVELESGHFAVGSDLRGSTPAFWFIYRIEESGENFSLVAMKRVAP